MKPATDPKAESGDLTVLVESWSAFWTDAGVDLAFEDDPRDWIAEGTPPPAAIEKRDRDTPRPRPAPPRSADPPKIGGISDRWPATLAAFRDWWMRDPLLDTGPLTGRVPPAGEAGARLMVLVADPAADDGADLLSGTDGRLLDAMLKSMGLTRADCYLASALPRHTPAADWDRLADEGLGALLRHHIALVDPHMLAVFGGDLVNVLAPERFEPAQARGTIQVGPAESAREIAVLASYPLAVMSGRPHVKALWWQRWLSLSRPS